MLPNEVVGEVNSGVCVLEVFVCKLETMARKSVIWGSQIEGKEGRGKGMEKALFSTQRPKFLLGLEISQFLKNFEIILK